MTTSKAAGGVIILSHLSLFASFCFLLPFCLPLCASVRISRQAELWPKQFVTAFLGEWSRRLGMPRRPESSKGSLISFKVKYTHACTCPHTPFSSKTQAHMETHTQTHTLPQIKPLIISHTQAHAWGCLTDLLFVIQNLISIAHYICLSLLCAPISALNWIWLTRIH